jgi:hypothetical protein
VRGVAGAHARAIHGAAHCPDIFTHFTHFTRSLQQHRTSQPLGAPRLTLGGARGLAWMHACAQTVGALEELPIVRPSRDMRQPALRASLTRHGVCLRTSKQGRGAVAREVAQIAVWRPREHALVDRGGCAFGRVKWVS